MMVKTKKYTLNIDDEVEFDVFGLSTPFADYRLAWALNENLEFKFEKSSDQFSIFDRKSKQLKSFQQFSFVDEENLTQIFLIKNKQGNQIVTAEHLMMDYFLIIKNNFTLDLNKLLTQLRNTNGIVAAFKLEQGNFDFLEEMN
jgi:hypothetical protein